MAKLVTIRYNKPVDVTIDLENRGVVKVVGHRSQLDFDPSHAAIDENQLELWDAVEVREALKVSHSNPWPKWEYV